MGSTDGVVPPNKVDRLVLLLQATHDELATLHVDEGARHRLAEMHRALVIELASVLDDAQIEEMVALGLGPVDPGAGLDELRVAHAQLLGWARGVAACVQH
jgi:hypothetical protein